MTGRLYILPIVLLGLFLTPTLTYACGKPAEKTEKPCCKKETSQTREKDCCKSHSQKDKNDDGCGGKCKNTSCHCPTINITNALPFVPELKHGFFPVEKQSVLYTESYISSGLRSIWLPPKIS